MGSEGFEVCSLGRPSSPYSSTLDANRTAGAGSGAWGFLSDGSEASLGPAVGREQRRVSRE